MNIVNLQQHPVTVMPNDRTNPVTFMPMGEVQVRMKERGLTPNKVIRDGHWTHTRGLPKPEEGTLYIVGSLVAMFELYHNDRTDLLFPWGLVRDDNGRVIGCRALMRPKKG